MDDLQRTNLTKGIAESKAIIKAFKSGNGSDDQLGREQKRLAYLEARLVRFSA